ncbi:MAG TPA: hypothetical protein VGL59_06500, partial [Polyangia bacterium]
MRSADIIPIVSRRRSTLKKTAAPTDLSTSSPPRSARWIVLIAVGAFFLVAGLFLLAGDHNRRTLGRIESVERGAIFERAYVDLEETCRLPEAGRDPLRQHCMNQAAFVLLFPECAADCQRGARSFLPHVGR